MDDCSTASPLAGGQHPDRIYLGGSVRTMVGAGRATAFAVRDGRFVAVGSDAEIESLAGPDTASVDLGGRAVLPGFIETHVHPHMSGACSLDVDAGVEACPDIESVIGALVARAATAAPGGAVRASGFDDSLVADDRGLTSADLDRADTSRPIVVRHLSGHGVYVNSFVLQSKGIGRDTPDPEGGVIVRDAAGHPTGEFREIPAMRLVVDPSESMPAAGDLDDALRRALARMASVGVTSFHDMFVTPVMADSYRRLFASGELLLRGRLYAGFGTLDGFGVGNATATEGDDILSIGGVKLISDGSIQLHTGALSEPYHDLGGCHCGDMAIPPGDLDEMVARCHAAGRQVAIHTNGDRAIDVALDAIEKARVASGGVGLAPPGLQHRLEHVQTLREDQILRMRELGVAASVFVNHVYYWGDRHRVASWDRSGAAGSARSRRSQRQTCSSRCTATVPSPRSTRCSPSTPPSTASRAAGGCWDRSSGSTPGRRWRGTRRRRLGWAPRTP